MTERPVYEAIAARRSVRRFLPEPVDAGELARLARAAYFAPAPHHSTPWRFAVVVEHGAKAGLAQAMAARWIADMRADGIDANRARRLADRSIERLSAAPALLLACLVSEGLDQYPDERRQRAEWGMALQSLGAALQNIMLAAAETGYGCCWIAAPIFAPDEARKSLGLPEGWIPQALLMVGRADPTYVPRPRPGLDFDSLVSVI